MSARRAAIVLLAALAATGCRALGINPGRPEAVLPPPSLAVTQLVERHNENAERLTSLEATPAVKANFGTVSGQMALVRPLDFRLSLSTVALGHRMADMGSNGQDYWFWMATRSKEREYYVGHFDEHGEASPGLIFQPDWIIEALGLRVIPEPEAKQITTAKGDAAGTITLVHHRPGPGGETRLKKTIVDKQSGEVREHLFYAPDNRTLLARAYPSDYRPVPIPASGEKAAGTVSLPHRIRVITTPPGGEAMDMEIILSKPTVNQFAAARAGRPVPGARLRQGRLRPGGHRRADAPGRRRILGHGPARRRDHHPRDQARAAGRCAGAVAAARTDRPGPAKRSVDRAHPAGRRPARAGRHRRRHPGARAPALQRRPDTLKPRQRFLQPDAPASASPGKPPGCHGFRFWEPVSAGWGSSGTGSQSRTRGTRQPNDRKTR